MNRILVIDDDAPFRSVLEQMLTRAGYEVATAGNGREGLELQRKAPAPLVITDLIMPEKEGMETIIELRRDFPETKIIAISGGGRHGSQDFLPIAQKLGAVRTLEKPFSREHLLEAVTAVLG